MDASDKAMREEAGFWSEPGRKYNNYPRPHPVVLRACDFVRALASPALASPAL